MSFPVIWLPEAEVSFNQNLDYLGHEWPAKVKTDFINRVDKVIRLASANPNLYPVYRMKDQVRKCVVHPRITMYFKVRNGTLYLITFWNTYRDPKKLKL